MAERPPPPPRGSKRKRGSDDDEASETSEDPNAYLMDGRFSMWQLDYFDNHFTTWSDWDKNHSEHQSDQIEQ